MLSFPAAVKVYLCTVPCDMRRSFDGLSMMAEHVIRCNPFSGHLLVFVSTSSHSLREQIEQVQKELAALGPIHPGSLSEQYNVCGTPGCRCKDPEHPQKHGPYYQLSFTWRGKSSSRFVKQDRLEATRRKVANYKQLRERVNRWVDLAVELERTEREEAKASHGD